jgi:hypothetical protein
MSLQKSDIGGEIHWNRRAAVRKILQIVPGMRSHQENRFTAAIGKIMRIGWQSPERARGRSSPEIHYCEKYSAEENGFLPHLAPFILPGNRSDIPYRLIYARRIPIGFC